MFFGRGKNKIQNPYTLKDTYKFYCEDVRSSKIYDIPYETYKNICNDFYKEMMNHVVERNGTFKMPYRMGSLFVLKEKVNVNKLNGHSVDWKLTNECGKLVFHLNEHTNGYKYTYQWDKKETKLPNLYYYRLVPTRANKRRLAELIKTGDYDYFERQ